METGITVPSDLSSWEAVATAALAQAIGATQVDASLGANRGCGVIDLLAAAGLRYSQTNLRVSTFNYDAAFRLVDQDPRAYVSTLALASGILYTSKLQLALAEPPKLGHFPGRQKGIVLAPYGIRQELDLPRQVWFAVETLLRSYGVPVYLVGDPGQRMDNAAFAEHEILSDLGMQSKIDYIAEAALVVGVPNAWTWMAASFDRKLAYLYPETLPPRRWFHYQSNNFGRILFHPNKIQLPVALAGLRELIRGF